MALIVKAVQKSFLMNLVSDKFSHFRIVAGAPLKKANIATMPNNHHTSDIILLKKAKLTNNNNTK
jgi:hypothetical protein